MRFFLLDFFVMLNLLCVAQPFPRLEFEHFNSTWIHYASTNEIDDSIINFDPVEPLVIGNSVYFTHNLFGESYYSGHLTQRVNMISGENEWNYYFYTSDLQNRELAQTPYVENDRLSMLIYKEFKAEENLVSPRWMNSFPFKRQLDIQTGLLLEQYIIDSTLVRAPRLRNQEPTNVSSSIFQKGSKYEYNMMIGLNPGVSRFEYVEFSDSTSNDKRKFARLSRNKIIYRVASQNKIDINSDSFYLIRHFILGGEVIDSFVLKFECMTRKLDVVKDFDITDQVVVADSFILIYATEKDFVIMGQRFIDTLDEPYVNYDFYHYDEQGELLEMVSIENESKLLKINNAVVLNGNHRMLIVGSDQSDDIQSLLFLRSDGVGHLEQIKEIFSGNESDRFSCRQLIQLEDNNFLINLSHSNVDFEKPDIQLSVWVKMDSEELGIYTSTENYVKSQVSFCLSPNPTMGIVNIDFCPKSFPQKTYIYNVLGELIKMVDFDEQIQMNLFQRGIYIIELRDDKGNIIGSQKIIKL